MCLLTGHSTAWVLENKRLTLHHGWLGFIIQSQLQATCISILLIGNCLIRSF
jgi:hypothetical protein